MLKRHAHTHKKIPNRQVDQSLPPLYIFAFTLVIVTIAVFLRFWQLSSRPGLEWDEPVYYSVASNLANFSELKAKSSIGVDEPYLYHPPFYFHYLAEWLRLFGDSIETARILAASMSLGMFVSVYLLLRDQLNRQNTLLLLLVLVTDGWIVYTNRISVIENTLLLLILLALLYYQFAYRGNWGKGQRFALYILAGSLMGFAGVFKHTGLYVLLVIPIHWLLIRRHTWEHISALVAACMVIALYLAWMVLSYDQEFLRQLVVQVRRVTGFYTSRGVISVTDLVTSAFGTYSVFIGSILLATSSIIFILVKLARAIKQRSLTILRGGTSLYLSWTLAALIFFGLISLKFPQYFMLVLVPMYCYVGAELLHGIQRYHPESYKWFVCFVVLVVGLNAASFVERFMLQDDNAIIEAVTYAWDYIPKGAVVTTDEPIGSIISQEYLRIDDWEVWMEILPPAYIITYTTQTQKLPDSQPLRDLIADSIKHHKITGFKEIITIYEVPPYSPGSP